MTDPENNRRFGLTLAAAVAVVFGVVLPLVVAEGFWVWPWLISAALVFVALVYPAGLAGVRRGWMAIADVLHRVNTRILLGAVFFLLITPIGVIMRLFRHDPLDLNYESNLSSFLKPAADHQPDHYEKPF